MRSSLERLPPGGSPISVAAMLAVLRESDPERALRQGLTELLPARWISLHRSGREALRVAFLHLAATTGRGEIIVPAYTCYSVPAAAVAAGLRVRLVDVNLRGQVDANSLRSLPLERAAALVVSNLFGVAEPLAAVIGTVRDDGVLVIDDAAQSLGSTSPEGPVGARGDVGLLSFGRGKPLSALGGGALVWKHRPESTSGDLELAVAKDPGAPVQRVRAVVRAAAYDLARVPAVLRILAAVPALGIGTTVYDPGFPNGPITGEAVALAAALLPQFETVNQARAQRAGTISKRLEAETTFQPLLSPADAIGIYPRLAVLAPDTVRRETALSRLGWLGVTAMYPNTLDRISALEPHLAGASSCPGAHSFCNRLLTVPTHTGFSDRHLDRLVGELQRLT